MQGGIVYSNAVTTVSPTYAHEAVHGGAAGYLNSTLAGPRVRPKFHGILNGIDAGLWDPERDPWIPASFSAADLAGKQLCKRQAPCYCGHDVRRIAVRHLGYMQWCTAAW